MIPSVNIQKLSSNAGTVVPSPQALALLAPCGGAAASGIVNVPTTFNQPNALQQQGAEGPLVDWGTSHMLQAKLPVLAVASSCSTPGSYGAIVTTKTGTFTPSAGSAAALADDYPGILVKFITGGTLGTAGITYQYSPDNGGWWSPVTALGTATTLSLTVPVTGADSGIRIALGTVGQTVGATDSFTLSATGPRMQLSDLETSLEALRVTQQKWGRCLLVHGETSASGVSVLDTWLAGLEAVGKFRTAIVNTRLKTLAMGSTATAETEPAYATAMQTVVQSATSIRVLAGADGGQTVSPVTGLTKLTPTSRYVATRSAQYSSGVMPEEQDLGPIPDAQIADAQGNPLMHDELLYDTLDGLRLTTLRSDSSEDGVFIDNSNMLAPSGSDYVYLPYALVQNDLCEAAYAELKTLLSQGIRVNPETGFIMDDQAATWEAKVTAKIEPVAAGQCSGFKFTLSRTDSMTGNGPKTVTGFMAVVGLKYVKQFQVASAYVNTLPS
jgi:hypothetical protein